MLRCLIGLHKWGPPRWRWIEPGEVYTWFHRCLRCGHHKTISTQGSPPSHFVCDEHGVLREVLNADVERPLQVRAGHCIHYRGALDHDMNQIKCCDAGVDIRALVGGVKPGWLTKLPCSTPIGNLADADRVPCDKRVLPTSDQIEAWEKWYGARWSKIVEAIVRAREHANGKRGVSASIECPECKGRLTYSIALSNGHLWGHCETAECLSWRQ